MYVQFSDAAETTIVGAFASPQDAAVYPNLADVPETDARYVAFLSSIPAELQKSVPAA